MASRDSLSEILTHELRFVTRLEHLNAHTLRNCRRFRRCDTDDALHIANHSISSRQLATNTSTWRHASRSHHIIHRASSGSRNRHCDLLREYSVGSGPQSLNPDAPKITHLGIVLPMALVVGPSRQARQADNVLYDDTPQPRHHPTL